MKFEMFLLELFNFPSRLIICIHNEQTLLDFSYKTENSFLWTDQYRTPKHHVGLFSTIASDIVPRFKRIVAIPIFLFESGEMLTRKNSSLQILCPFFGRQASMVGR